jgi:ATP-binding cassette subfamily B protein
MPNVVRSTAAALRLQWEASAVLCVLPLLTSVVAGIAPAIGADAMRTLVDKLSARQSVGTFEIAVLVGIIVAAGAIAQMLSQLTLVVASASRRRLTVLAARRLFGRTTSFTGLRYLEDPEFCDRLAMAEQSAHEVPSILTSSVPQIVQATIVIASFVGAVYLVWPPMLLLLAVVAVPSFVAQRRRAHEYANVSVALAMTGRLGIVQRLLTTDASAAKEMRVFGFGSYVSERYASLLDLVGRETLKVDRRTAITQCGLFALGAVALAAGLWVVADGVRHGTFSLGDLTLFIAAITAIQGALSGIVLRSGEIIRGLRLFSNYTEVIATPDDLPSGSRAAPELATIELRDVWFRYEPTQEWVLRGVTLTIPAGTTTALVGMNGAGKTTIVKLLCRFYDPERGSITWNGIDLREFDPASLRSRIAAVFQDHRVYELTAAENIGLGSLPQLDDRAAVARAAVQASIDKEIQALPHGYDTLLSRLFVDAEGRTGVALSGGQAQRLALARAYMRPDASLVLLDEPNSSLDAKTEAELLSNLTSDSMLCARVFVSHRLALLGMADHVAVLKDGVVVEHGSHDDLLGRDGEYASMWNAGTPTDDDEVESMLAASQR